MTIGSFRRPLWEEERFKKASFLSPFPKPVLLYSPPLR